MARFSQGSGSSNNSAPLNYVQVAGSQQIISSAPNAIVDLDITTTGAPVQISVTGEGANASAGSWLRLNLFRDNVEIGNAIQLESSAASENVPFAINFIDAVAAGTYNYSARVTSITGGSWTFGEAAGPVINAVELTGFEGDRGPRGFTGADALWNFTGAYDLGASYAIGDVVTYEGQTWYRLDANGGNTGDTPAEGDFWTLIASKGDTGDTANIADFVFDEDGDLSTMTVANHDMAIRTTRDDGQDADISIESADDVWVYANGDDIHLYAADDVEITTGYESGNSYNWEFRNTGGLKFPDGTVQNTAYTGGSGGGGNTADFVFALDEDGEDTESRMTIHNHDMRIETTRDGEEDADIEINSADDIWIEANDEVEIRSTTDEVRIITNNYQTRWTFQADGGIRFPDDTVQTTAYTGNDAGLPQDLGTSDSPTFNKIILTSNNGEADNIAIGDDVFVGDANIANHVAIVGNQDPTNGGIILGNGLTETLSSDGSNLSLAADNDIVLYPGSTYAYIGTPELDGSNRIAKMSDIQGGGPDSHGNFEFNNSEMFTEGSMDINAKREDSALGAAIELDPNDGYIALFAYSSPRTNSFSPDDWSDAMWLTWGEGTSQVVLNGASSVITYIGEEFGSSPFQSISVNGSDFYTYGGGSSGDGQTTIYLEGGNPPFPTTVTSLEFKHQTESRIEIDDDDEEILIQGIGLDVNLESTEGITFRSNLNSNTEYTWAMGSNGEFRLPGDGYIQNVANGSGDGSGNDTIKIVPDSSLDNDQYIIIDPTFGSPNHIHIRAGGQQDSSSADLILGGERTHVRLSDTDGAVYVSSKREDTTTAYVNGGGFEANVLAIVGDLSHIQPYANFSVEVGGDLYQIDYVSYNSGTNVTQITATPATFEMNGVYVIHQSNGENYWAFNENGYLMGPAMGSLGVTGIINADGDLYIQSTNDKVVISSDSGEFLNDSSNPNNQIATIGDISNALPVETSFTVNGGTLGTQPTFDGAPLFSGSYVKTGPMVHFQVQVDMNNILTFGTGQYYVDLPFDSKYGYQFAAGCLHDVSTGRQYAIGGHVYAGQSQLLLSFTNSNGQDEPFDHNSPVTLTSEDNFHISGTYIAD
jgi:hypothetical protein